MRTKQRIDFIKIWVWRLFALLLVLAMGISLWQLDWFALSVSLTMFAIIILPSILEKALQIDFPSEFELALLFFIFASLYLGELQGYYTLFAWWDLLLHGVSGLIVGAFGFIVVYLMHIDKRISLRLSPLFLALFSFSFSSAIGVMWEIVEFTLDTLLGWNMQKSGLVDTMWDLIFNTIGALIISVLGYRYLKNERKPLQLVENWLKKRV